MAGSPIQVEDRFPAAFEVHRLKSMRGSPDLKR
jgi:hypothetical protein